MINKIRLQDVNDANKIEDEMLRNHILSYSSLGSMRNVYEHVCSWLEWLQENGNPSLRGKTPSELVEYQHQLNVQSTQSMKLVNRRVIINEIVRWASSNPKWRTRYKRKLASDISAFFNRTLEDNGGFPKLQQVDRNKLKGPPKVSKVLTFDVLRDVIGKSNALYRAIFSIMAASGMGAGEIVEWSNQGVELLLKTLENPISTNPTVISVHFSPRKANENDFYTYVGGPAINALKRWLKTREKMKANRPEEFPSSIFVGNWYTPIDERNISEYWLKQLKRLGLYESTSPKSNGQRSGMNVHLIRGIFKTQWEKSRAYLPIAESFMGHLVDALDYSRVMDDKEWVLGEYLKALSYLDVSHDDPSLQASTVRELNSKLSDQDEKIKAQDKQIKDLQEYTKLVKPLLNMALLNQTGITPILSPEEAEKIKKSLLLDKEKGER